MVPHPGTMGKTKFKNDQEVCWLEEDYMEMKLIARNQSRMFPPDP